MPEIIQLGLAEPGGHSVSPDSRHMCVSLLFSQGWGGGSPLGPTAISDVPGQAFYIMAHLLSCVLEKIAQQIWIFTENIV